MHPDTVIAVMLVTFGILARTLLSPKVHWRLLTLVGGKEGANRAMTTKAIALNYGEDAMVFR